MNLIGYIFKYKLKGFNREELKNILEDIKEEWFKIIVHDNRVDL